MPPGGKLAYKSSRRGGFMSMVRRETQYRFLDTYRNKLSPVVYRISLSINGLELVVRFSEYTLVHAS